MLLALGCGRRNFELVDAAGDDAVPSDDAAIDAAPATGPFGAPAEIPELASAGFDDDPTLTADLLEIYFSSSRPGGMDTNGDIWFSTRPSAASPWGTPALVPVVNTAVEDQSAGISADGLTLYFSSRRTAALTGSNIWMSTRATRQAAWQVPVLVTELSTNQDDFEPQPDPSGLRLVMYRDLGGGDRAVFESTRGSSTVPWGTPVKLTAIETAGSERSPCLADDGRALYFSSDRASGTANVHDLFVATRATTGDPFVSPMPLVELDSSGDNDDPWISPDGHVLVFSSQRTGDSAIYQATR
jgi:Tol biopolymer transport system component